MPKTTRTFIAVAIPDPLGQKLTRLQAQLAPDVPGARLTTTLPFHVTLAFMGDVLDVDLNQVCTAVAESADPFPPYEVRLEGVGAFPNPARPRVIWAGLTATDPSPLLELRKAIVRGVTRVGYRPDDQRFTPHTTLGRIKSDRRGPHPPDLTKVLEPYQAWSAGSFTVSEVITFASTLTPEGPIYAPLARAPLTGKKTTA
jgi:2'-5' RNA ligase